MRLDSMQGDPSENADLFAIDLTSRLLASDMLNEKNISFGFGGGYEIAIYNDGKVAKLTDILHTGIHIDEDGTFISLPLVKFDYLDDLLVMRVVLLGSKGLFVQSHIVPPLDGSAISRKECEERMHELPDLNATYTAFHLSVNTRSGKT